VYANLLRHGHSRAAAEDITQGIFVNLLADESFVAADAEKGKLRTLLLCALQWHLTDVARH